MKDQSITISAHEIDDAEIPQDAWDKLIDEHAKVVDNPFQGIPLQTVKEMNNFRINFYKKNPKATERACRRALMRKFNITVPNNVSTKS